VPCRPACGAIACARWKRLSWKTLKGPDLVAEAEKTRMTLNPISVTILHNMIVECLSMPAAQRKEKLQSILTPKGNGRSRRHFGIRSLLWSFALSSFLDPEIPSDLEVIELFKNLVGTGPLVPLRPGEGMSESCGILGFSNLGKSNTGPRALESGGFMMRTGLICRHISNLGLDSKYDCFLLSIEAVSLAVCGIQFS
jgi:hypothetical protein